jgi:cell division protein FtsW (lipid II flippase)
VSQAHEHRQVPHLSLHAPSLPHPPLPEGTREVEPLLAMLFAVALPVGLAAAAAVGGGVVVLVIAIVAMLLVAGFGIAYIGRLTGDESD